MKCFQDDLKSDWLLMFFPFNPRSQHVTWSIHCYRHDDQNYENVALVMQCLLNQNLKIRLRKKSVLFAIRFYLPHDWFICKEIQDLDSKISQIVCKLMINSQPNYCNCLLICVCSQSLVPSLVQYSMMLNFATQTCSQSNPIRISSPAPPSCPHMVTSDKESNDRNVKIESYKRRLINQLVTCR